MHHGDHSSAYHPPPYFPFLPMFNPRPTIQLIPIPGHLPCIVIDDFLLEPEAMVAYATQQRDHFSMAPVNTFPGLQLVMPDDFSARLNDFFIQHIRRLLGARRTERIFSRLSMATLQPHELGLFQRICHTDPITTHPQQCFAASVLYLFDNPDLGGTSFYRPTMAKDELYRLFYSPDSPWCTMSNEEFTAELGVEPGYQTGSNKYFELINMVPAKWNRMIFYDAYIFHSAYITNPSLLSSDPTGGRLTINGFFTCRRAA
ncbi:DUF6445 family protein [Undibacterium sp. MH2W]|uniref:DUF6445 family protein n=1 Tax=Undibacterium sp. MH2W TaxID=3413044 RepID=UPI003BEF88AA